MTYIKSYKYIMNIDSTNSSEDILEDLDTPLSHPAGGCGYAPGAGLWLGGFHRQSITGTRPSRVPWAVLDGKKWRRPIPKPTYCTPQNQGGIWRIFLLFFLFGEMVLLHFPADGVT